MLAIRLDIGGSLALHSIVSQRENRQQQKGRQARKEHIRALEELDKEDSAGQSIPY